MIRPLSAFFLCSFLFGCSASIEPPNGTVNWSLMNGTGSNITLSVYDNVCKRSYFRVPVARSREAPLTTCANPNGRADIRYRPRSANQSTEFAWVDRLVNADQVVIVR